MKLTSAQDTVYKSHMHYKLSLSNEFLMYFFI